MAHPVLLPARRRVAAERDSRRPGVLRVIRAALRSSREHDLTTRARALAYSLFLAIPSALLVALGAFVLLADSGDLARLVARLQTVVPAEVAELAGDSLERQIASRDTGVAMAAVGLVLALWSTTSAATSLMEGVTAAFDRRDERGFVRRRLIALAIVACLVVSALLVVALLVLGPHLSRWVGDASGRPTLTGWLWWTAQWPLLLAALLLAFAVVLTLGPDVRERQWRLVTPGALVALLVWLAASAALAVYSARFGSFDKTWGTLSAVVVTLVWLWLGSAALLFGAEVNARSQELARHGGPFGPEAGRGDEPRGPDSERRSG